MNNLMDDETPAEKLNKLVERLFGDPLNSLRDNSVPPFDIEKTNIHESKKEFLLELKLVQNVIQHLDGVVNEILGPPEDDVAHRELVARVGAAIDQATKRHRSRNKIEGARGLALQNIADTGYFYGSIFVILEVKTAYEQRLKELRGQEAEFWSLANRAPNYHARTIALRFARYYAVRKKSRPTFGISSQGAHPSTEFGRALEEVFTILGIRANLRKAAVWALDQLTEADWNPPQNALAGPQFGGLSLGKSQKGSDETRKIIAAMLADKGS